MKRGTIIIPLSAAEQAIAAICDAKVQARQLLAELEHLAGADESKYGTWRFDPGGWLASRKAND